MNATMSWADVMKIFMGEGLRKYIVKKFLNLKVYGANNILLY